jgi:hypothetical protein
MRIKGDKESASGIGHTKTLEYLCSVYLPCHLHTSTILMYLEKYQPKYRSIFNNAVVNGLTLDGGQFASRDKNTISKLSTRE